MIHTLLPLLSQKTKQNKTKQKYTTDPSTVGLRVQVYRLHLWPHPLEYSLRWPPFVAALPACASWCGDHIPLTDLPVIACLLYIFKDRWRTVQTAHYGSPRPIVLYCSAPSTRYSCSVNQLWRTGVLTTVSARLRNWCGDPHFDL